MASFREALHQQRWDDHRFYHHSMINQSLHFFSACTFIGCYILLPFDPGVASFIAWTFAMLSRQSGHFFFEPHTYDNVNDVSHEYKEEVKTGYNLFRKWVLMSIWALSPLFLLLSPTLFGLYKGHMNWLQVIRRVGIIWLAVGIGGVLFRVIQLFFIQNVQTGIIWGVKILTDPFSDFVLYHKSVVRLLHGELMDHGLIVHASSDESHGISGEMSDDTSGEPSVA